METLTQISQRIEKVTQHLPKHKHVADMAITCLNQLFHVEVPDVELDSNKAKLKYRIDHLNKFLHSHPKNIELR